jgi:toxin ParE1/3/4
VPEVARYAVSFDRAAVADFADIRDYIAEARGREFADAFIGRIIAYCESLSTVPHRGTRRDAIRPGLRTVTWRRAVTIAFAVSDERRSVLIAGAFYRGRNVAAQLRERQKENP